MIKSTIPIHILKILAEHSSDQNRLTQQQILYYLKTEYEDIVVRNTLSKYIRELRDEGYINGVKGICLNRIFTNEEIKVLSDGLIYMRDIPKEQLYELAKKLDCFTYCEHSNYIQNKHIIDSIVHTHNPNVLDNIARLNAAIKSRKKVCLQYFKCDIHGRLYKDKSYEVSPYYIVTSKDHFYLLCYNGRQNIEPRRLDRILSVTELEEKRVEIKEIPCYQNDSFRLEEYMKTHIYMYSGETKNILLKVKKKNIGDVIDWFGTEYRIMEEGEEYVNLRLYANEDAVVFWALQYGRIAEVLEPVSLRQKIYERVKELEGMYGEERGS